MASEVQTRLRLDCPIVRQCPRDPLGKFLLIGLHTASHLIACNVHHFWHCKHLRYQYAVSEPLLENYTSISENRHIALSNCMRIITETRPDAIRTLLVELDFAPSVPIMVITHISIQQKLDGKDV